MGRLLYILLWIVMIVLDGITNGFGYRRARRFYGSFGQTGYSYDWEMMSPENNRNRGLGAAIRCYLRRHRALKTCDKYCTRANYIITVKNQKVTVLFDTNNKTLTCLDNTSKERSATVVWPSQIAYMPQDRDNIFEMTFDNICFSFSGDATYGGILRVLKDNFEEVYETNPPSPPPKYKAVEQEDEPIKMVVDKLVDINNATAEQIATLPGINIILAKRIVKYRDLKGEIKSKEELFREFKIREHFQKEISRLALFTTHRKTEESYNKINKNIIESVQQQSSKNNDNNNNDKGGGERIIDF